MKRLIGLALVALVLLGPATGEAQALTWRKARVLALINGVRADDLRPGWRIAGLAQDHSERMASAGRIWHSYSCYCGEIVGVTVPGRLGSLFDAWMHSPTHRAVILDHRWDFAGIGIAERDGFLYVTVIFRAWNAPL